MIKKWYKRIVPEKTRNKARSGLHKIISPLYYGSRFYCPCCQKSFRRLLSKGYIRRENAQCPFCLSLERTRVLDVYLDREFNLYKRRHLAILHFAPEIALFNKLSNQPEITYIDVDINPANARNEMDITAIPYLDNQFDFIICSHVLGHVPDESRAINELYRVLKPGGSALIMTLLSKTADTFENPAIKTEAERLTFYGEPDLVRLHGKDFEKRLQAPGFKIEAIDYRLQFSEEIRQKYALGDGQREVIFRCWK